MAQNADYAGLGSRGIALIIDGVILAVVIGVLSAVLVMLSGLPRFMETLLGFIGGFAGLAYFVVLEARSGQTLGKQLVNIRVVKKDGSSMDMVASLIRNLLRIADGMFLYLVGIIVIIATEDDQRIGDIVAGTVVVKE